MATNWNEILSNTNNLNDVLSILKKVLAGLEVKADSTTINEALQDIEVLKVDISAEVENVNTALDQFQAQADEVIAAGFFKGFATETALKASLPTVSEMRARADDTRKIWRWNRTSAEGVTPITGTWIDTGLSDVDQAKNYTDSKLPIIKKLYDSTKNVANVYVGASSPYNVASSAGTMLSIFPVDAGKTYSVKTNAVSFPAFAIALRATNSTAIGATLGIVALTSTSDPTIKTFTVPLGSTAKFALVNIKIPSVGLDASLDLLINEGLIIVEYDQIKKIDGAEIIDEKAREIMIGNTDLITTAELYNASSNADGKYVNSLNSQIASSAGTMLTVFPVLAGYSYAIKSSGINNSAALLALRATNSTAIGATLGIVALTSTSDPTIKTFTVPLGSTAKFAFLNVKVPSVSLDLTSDLHINAGGFYTTSIIAIGVKEKPLADPDAQRRIMALEATAKPSRLYSKKWVVIGDSITEKNFRASKNYHEYVAEDVGGMTIYNYGISGSGFWNRSGVANTITQNPDYITVFWGANDLVRAPKILGNRDSTGTDSLGGLMNTAISALIAKFYDKKFAVFTLLPRDIYNNVTNTVAVDGSGVSQGYTATQVADLTIAICEKYSIPVLDLYRESNLYPWIPAVNELYFKADTEPSGDGLHPNAAGQRAIADKMKVLLESL